MDAPLGDERLWPAPAKLNLFLHITGRRPDGYHELQTVFQFLDWGDQLRIEPRADGELLLHEGTPGVQREHDLVYRAAYALQVATGTRRGADIWLHKRIPIGAGLGGGSSDAATTLLALNRLWRTQLGPERLAALGARLGADVPVFVHGHAAWAEGVGERLTPIGLPEPWYLVLVPDCSVATASVFAAPDLHRDHPPVTPEDFLAGYCGNDCWPVVRKRYPQIVAAYEWLGQFAPPRLTGTGSALFASFESRTAARQVAEKVSAPWRTVVARGINRSPVLALSEGAALQ